LPLIPLSAPAHIRIISLLSQSKNWLGLNFPVDSIVLMGTPAIKVASFDKALFPRPPMPTSKAFPLG
jgi:hypothetical protein